MSIVYHYDGVSSHILLDITCSAATPGKFTGRVNVRCSVHTKTQFLDWNFQRCELLQSFELAVDSLGALA